MRWVCAFLAAFSRCEMPPPGQSLLFASVIKVVGFAIAYFLVNTKYFYQLIKKNLKTDSYLDIFGCLYFIDFEVKAFPRLLGCL